MLEEESDETIQGVEDHQRITTPLTGMCGRCAIVAGLSSTNNTRGGDRSALR